MNYKDCWYLAECPKAPDDCRQACIKFQEMLYLLQESNIPESRWFPTALYPGIDIEAYLRLRDIKVDIENYIKQGNNLYIYSENSGNGKTSWAIKLMLAYFDKVWAGNGFRRRGIFLSIPEFMDRNREIINNRDPEFVKLREDALECDLVVWDDVASAQMTDFSHSLFLNYLDARVLGNKANIFTSNLDFAMLEKQVGKRLASRLYNTSEVIHFADVDKRGRK